jgi:hypothetical protein
MLSTLCPCCGGNVDGGGDGGQTAISGVVKISGHDSLSRMFPYVSFAGIRWAHTNTNTTDQGGKGAMPKYVHVALTKDEDVFRSSLT